MAIETIKDDLKKIIDGFSYYTDPVSDPSDLDILFGTGLGNDVYIRNHPGNIRFRYEMFDLFKDQYESSYNLNLFSKSEQQQRCHLLLRKAVQYIYSFSGRCLQRDEDEDCWIPLDLVGARERIRLFLYRNKTRTEEEKSKLRQKNNQHQHRHRNLKRLHKQTKHEGENNNEDVEVEEVVVEEVVVEEEEEHSVYLLKAKQEYRDYMLAKYGQVDEELGIVLV
jgi:hypothetical protein